MCIQYFLSFCLHGFRSHLATRNDYIYMHIITPLSFANISIESC